MELRQSLTPGRRGMLVRLTASEGMRPALLDALHRYSDGLEEEPGTEVFIVHVDPDDANIVWLYEMFAQLMTELPDVLGAPPAILRLDPLRMSLQEQVLSEDLTF